MPDTAMLAALETGATVMAPSKRPQLAEARFFSVKFESKAVQWGG
jgi:hypothetical protein